MTDVYQIIDSVDLDKQRNIAERLEARALMDSFRQARQDYFLRTDFSKFHKVLEVGCGTGVVAREIARHPDFNGTVVGTDISSVLVDEAKKLAEAEGIENVSFRHADDKEQPDDLGEYDLVLAHTVLSHVVEPDAFLGQLEDMARPGGTIIIHDGDYASMTFDTGATELDRTLPAKYLDAIVANRFVMREVPRRIAGLSLVPHAVHGTVVIEAGQGEYFPTTITNYGPIVESSGMATKEQVEAWSAACRQALSENRFFGSCNFLTYWLTKNPS